MARIKKLLIANRSEIALRIMATCHTKNIETIAIYSEEDQNASYVFQANQAYKLTQSGAQAYLAQDEIIAIAKMAGADAIHPGYGFLAENASFAKKVLAAGFIWVGPKPEHIALMADKLEAQKIMFQAGIPIIPRLTKKDLNNPSVLPVIIKCAHGGGGKAMRIIRERKDVETTWNTVVSEAKTFFGSTKIIVEKYIERGKHVEVQVAGDGSNVIHFYERDCSIQRRQQKIIEEAPCNFIRQKTKEKLYEYAIRAAKAVSYTNLGTVEFLVDRYENIFFLEMNTRLQVEHAITEMTTGIDLVALQIDLAENGALPYSQKDIFQQGHAIECRIYSEDPQQNFLPQTGTVTNILFPSHAFVRTDHDLQQLTQVTPLFDPMIAKISTYGENRHQAIQRMNNALARTNISGIITNLNFLRSLIKTNLFTKGTFHTQMLQQKEILKQIISQANKPDPANVNLALKALEIFQKQLTANNKKISRIVTFEYKGQREKARLLYAAKQYVLIYLFRQNATIRLSLMPGEKIAATTSDDPIFISEIKSPLSGRIISINIKANEEVEKDTPLITIESMKMENEILAPVALFIKSIHIEIGHLVQQGQVLLNCQPIKMWENRNEPNRQANE